ncbi:MAG: SDR family oxidoreductase [Rhodospirillaceae bacterium]|nr:SDR family oxidoreductase [Rhodospirillaceae bacterium]
MVNPPFAPSSLQPVPKTALITGAARRIGRALAEALAADGWAVAVHYHGAANSADDTLAAIKAKGGRGVGIEADLSDHAAVERIMPAAVKALGPIGCLINNASIFERDEIATATLASWEHHMAINLRAPFFLSQAFAGQLPATSQGAIINIIDERVWHLTPHFASYTVSKAGLWTLTQTLALALAPRIRVNAIGPGPTLPSPRQSQAQFDAFQAKMPLGRGTTPAEICAAARFILAAPALTGQMIALDGGQHLGWGQVPKDADPED